MDEAEPTINVFETREQEDAYDARVLEQIETEWNKNAENALPSLPRESTPRVRASEDKQLGPLPGEPDADLARLTTRQRAVLTALVAGRTIAAVSQQFGVSRTTLYRWRKEPAFERVLTRMGTEAIEASAARARNVVLKSLSLLAEALNGRDRYHWAMRVANSRRLWDAGQVKPGDVGGTDA